MKEITALAPGPAADICDRFRHSGVARNYFLTQMKRWSEVFWSAHGGFADDQAKLKGNNENHLFFPLC